MTGDRISLPCAPDPFPALAKATPRERGFLDAFLWGPDKVPVLVRKTGLHPEATLPDGTTTGKSRMCWCRSAAASSMACLIRPTSRSAPRVAP